MKIYHVHLHSTENKKLDTAIIIAKSVEEVKCLFFLDFRTVEDKRIDSITINELGVADESYEESQVVMYQSTFIIT